MDDRPLGRMAGTRPAHFIGQKCTTNSFFKEESLVTCVLIIRNSLKSCYL